ncbi:hypothetical protein CPB84DRAFT_1782189 [Gymnopilus junonius]|uniref:C2H2-type domain-containing protein n=1 Tax=Gymnopilus junonius TaxID=109634 RepID=A0A9P5TLU2_GYMJU|nr:hypothetical protein CPB84DRAFT_1782189 [Gymnopilus junonius]
MPSSLEHKRDQDTRPTLPSIRDLFREELARRPYLHDSPSVTLRRLRISDDESDYVPHEDTISRPFYQSLPSRHSESAFSPSPQYFLLSSQSNTSAFGKPVAEPRPSFHHNGPNFSEFGTARDELFERDPDAFRRPRHRQTVPQPSVSRDSFSPNYGYTNNAITRQRSETVLSETSSRPYILTSIHARNIAEDEERTPVARSSSSIAHRASSSSISLPLEPQNLGESSGHKYDCSYCGKIFNRPSSLKIHLNSHLGLKPFACPVEGCGRCFSVLSNMRRHTRVHQTAAETESDSSRPSSSHSRSSLPSPAVFRRRGSSASTSSTTSRRSYSSISSTER